MQPDSQSPGKTAKDLANELRVPDYLLQAGLPRSSWLRKTWEGSQDPRRLFAFDCMLGLFGGLKGLSLLPVVVWVQQYVFVCPNRMKTPKEDQRPAFSGGKELLNFKKDMQHLTKYSHAN